MLNRDLTLPRAPVGTHVPHYLGAARFGKISRSLRTWMSRCVVQAQIAQMTSVLNRMTDDQLHAIGLSRTDIPAHAVKLIAPESEVATPHT